MQLNVLLVLAVIHVMERMNQFLAQTDIIHPPVQAVVILLRQENI